MPVFYKNSGIIWQICNSSWCSSSRKVHIGIGVIVDSVIVAINKIGHNSSISSPFGRSSGKDVMTMAIVKSGVCWSIWVMSSSKVMTNLMTKCVISKSTGFFGYRNSETTSIRVKIPPATAAQVIGQQNSWISSVSQLLQRTFHISKSIQNNWRAWIILIDSSLFSAELLNSNWNLTVGISLIGLSNNLVCEICNIWCCCSKLRGIIKHDSIGHNIISVRRIRGIAVWNFCIISIQFSLFFKKCMNIKLFKNVSILTFFQSKRFSIICLQRAKDVASFHIQTDDSFISKVCLVDAAMRRNGVGEGQFHSIDRNRFLRQKTLRININIIAGQSVKVTAWLCTSWQAGSWSWEQFLTGNNP